MFYVSVSDSSNTKLIDVPCSEHTRFGGLAVANSVGTIDAGTFEKRVVQVGGHGKLERKGRKMLTSDCDDQRRPTM